MSVKSAADRRKIVLLLLFIIVLVIFGVIVIDFVGNLFGVYVPLPGLKLIKSISLNKKIRISEDPYLLEREELSKEKDRLSLLEEQLINKEIEIDEKNLTANKKLETLKERERELDKKAEFLEYREKQWDDKQQNIREQAVKLYNMPPNDAVAILEKQSEADIVDIIRAIDGYSEELGKNSTSPYLLKLMNDINPDKASNVLRKLKYSVKESNSSVDSVDDITDEILNP